MKIALLGYGRMGKTIEQIALQKGHEIVLKVDENTIKYDITLADVAIDFSIPSVAFKNISNCLNNNVPVVSGTTGWLDKFDEATDLCNKNKGGFIYEQQNRRVRPFKILAARTIGYEREGSKPVGLEGAYSKDLSGIKGEMWMQKIAGGV